MTYIHTYIQQAYGAANDSCNSLLIPKVKENFVTSLC